MVTLTSRQLDVLTGFSYGLTDAEIAQELGIGIETVKSHAKVVRSHLGAKNRSEAVSVGFRMGILTRESLYDE